MGLIALNLVLIDILRNICEISSCVLNHTHFKVFKISWIHFGILIPFPNPSDQNTLPSDEIH